MNKQVLLIESLGEADFRPGLFTRGNALEPYALECLAGAAEAKGFSAAVLQPHSMAVPEIVQHARQINPFCIGLSVWTHTADYAAALAASLKKALPNVTIVAGGQHPSLLPEYILETDFSYAVIGEGELTFPELLGFLSADRPTDPSGIPGLAFKSANGKALLRTHPRARISNLDALPPPKRIGSYLRRARSWNLTYPPPQRQTAVAQIGYSRGCRFRCTFCVSPPIWSDRHGLLPPHKSLTYRSAASVAAEVRKLHDDFGVNFLYFTDLTFNDNPERVRDLCKALIDAGLHEGPESAPGHLHNSVHWFALLKVGLDAQTAELMARAGCSKIAMGVESFDTARVHAYKKPYRGLTILEESLAAADHVGMIIRCLLVMGAPEETDQSIASTIEGLQRFPIDQIRVAFLTPYPNTPVYAQFSDKLAVTDWSSYDEEHPIIAGDHLSLGELYGARMRIAREFYSSDCYRARCQNKLHRFPWLREAYAWFTDDLFQRSNGAIDLRSVTTRPSLAEVPV